MARANSNKLYRTFVKGLVTEASPLTYPEDTSYDELNTILSRKGSRTRRLGIDYLANTLSASLEVTDNQISQNEYVWTTVNQQPNTNFLVTQKGLTVWFFDMSSNVSAESFKPFTIDLANYIISGWSIQDAQEQVYQMASGKGYLFIVGRCISPLVVKYNEDADEISVTPLAILIRDFDGLNDELANDEEPTTLTKEHHYNLLNQGWLYGTSSSSSWSPVNYDGYVLSPEQLYYRTHVETLAGDPIYSYAYSRADPTSGPIFKFHQAIGRYPGNNKQWWVARAEADDPDKNISAGDFLPNILNNLFSGNNRAPNGHFIVDAFRKDRSALSGISGLSIEELNYRPEAISFFSGRAWYGAGSTVYFSQILDSTGVRKAALCYQEADPTAEDISDLIASDGGVVPIPEADRIRKLIPMANGIIVIAQNGVWFVGAGGESFSATTISVSKVSSIGSKSPLAAIEVEDTLFWWNETGIQALQQSSGQFGPIPGKFGNTSISEQTIQSLFNAISSESKLYVKAAYDPRNNRLMWLFNDTHEGRHEYNKVLLFDLTLQAFFLWEFADIEEGPRVSGIYNNIGEAYASSTEFVVDEDGNTILTEALDEVESTNTSATYTPTNIQFLVNVPEDGLAIATLSNSSYVDWSAFDGTGSEYSSFVETGYELMADAMRDKQAVYVFVHFQQAEDSSCYMTTKWDWANGAFSNRWSNEVQVYRDRTRPNNSTADLDAFAVVTSKNKVRGSGKSVQFRFECNERNKNFELLGWSVAFVGNTQP
jgi:hypothetical protein